MVEDVLDVASPLGHVRLVGVHHEGSVDFVAAEAAVFRLDHNSNRTELIRVLDVEQLPRKTASTRELKLAAAIGCCNELVPVIRNESPGILGKAQLLRNHKDRGALSVSPIDSDLAFKTWVKNEGLTRV